MENTMCSYPKVRRVAAPLGFGVKRLRRNPTIRLNQNPATSANVVDRIPYDTYVYIPKLVSTGNGSRHTHWAPRLRAMSYP